MENLDISMKGGNLKLKNKRANGMAVFLIIIGVVIAGALVFGLVQTGAFTGGAQKAIQAQAALGDCETSPSITIGAVNSLKKGTTVTVVNQTRLNGQFVGTLPSNLQRGDEVELLITATNFLDKTLPMFTATCGAQTIPAELFATSTNSFRMFNTNGKPLTDQATGLNTTAGVDDIIQGTSASPINVDVRIDSSTDESTGDLIIVIEAVNTTEVNSIKLSGAGASDATTPKFYSPNAAGSIVETFRVPAILDGETKQLTLTISPETGITIGAGETAVYVTAYSEQAFVDTDGTFKVGVEDVDGTTKYEDTWDFDFCISADSAGGAEVC